jgi:hypothetical protein
MTPEEELMHLREENRVLKEQVKQRAALEELVQQLSEEVKRLQAHVAKDSHKSSLPPSSDRLSRQPKSRSLRQKSGNPPGGQPGHPGQRVQLRAEPTERIMLPQHCQADWTAVAVKSLERRQVIDVPPPPPLSVKQ